MRQLHSHIANHCNHASFVLPEIVLEAETDPGRAPCRFQKMSSIDTARCAAIAADADFVLSQPHSPVVSGDGIVPESLGATGRPVSDAHLSQKLSARIPSGVYIVPDLNQFRLWHGVIFIRNGIYRNGVFKFVVQFPEAFPETPPAICFVSDLYHPLVDRASGRLDLRRFQEWQPNDDVADILSYMKTIFVDTDHWNPERRTVAHPEAYRLWQDDEAAFGQRVQECVETSIDRVYVHESGSNIQFSAPVPEHDRLWERIRNQEPIQDLIQL